MSCAEFNFVLQNPAAVKNDGESTPSIIHAAWALLVGSYTDESTIRFSIMKQQGSKILSKKDLVQRTHLVEYQLDWDQIVSNIVEYLDGNVSKFPPPPMDNVRVQPDVLLDNQRRAPFQFALLHQLDSTLESKIDKFVWGQTLQNDSHAVKVRWKTQAKGLTVRIDVSKGLSDVLSATRLAAQLEYILQQILDWPLAGMRLANIQAASKGDLDQIWMWNSNVLEKHDVCIHELIQERASMSPNAPAICAWDGDLSYQELDRLSSIIAFKIIEFGVTKGDAIPICIEKSRLMPVAALAVMKAGAVCVALDVEQPQSRLKAITSKITPRIIVASPENAWLAKKLSKGEAVVEVTVDLEKELYTDECRLPCVQPSDIAYLSFTSGSTGIPKGAMISHSNVSSGIKLQAAELNFTESSRVLDLAPYCFDLAWTNMLSTLCMGGCLCVPKMQDCQTDLSGTIEKFEANMINITSSALRLVRPDTTGLQTILLSGEPADEDVVATWASRVKLLNTYGSAECPSKGVFAPISIHQKGKTLIGKGRATNTWIVNYHTGRTLCGIGMIGELWIEGPIVGQGYWMDPAQTAKVFVEDPAWALKGSFLNQGRQSRFYKTGDLVHYSADGSLLFVGRKDQMVKIRGQRIELGEVEHCIRQYLQDTELNFIKEALCELILPVSERKAQRHLLVSYFVTDEAPIDALRPMTRDLQAYLTRKLPSYMVPSLYIPMPRLPRTATGKLDRRKVRADDSALTLLELSARDPRHENSNRDPETLMEQRLKELWSTVLGIDQSSISALDSFFLLGGDSIAAIQLVGIAREEGFSLTVEDIFRYPELERLARLVRHAEAISEESIPRYSLLPKNIMLEKMIQTCASACGVGIEMIEDILPCTPTQEAFMAVTARKDDLNSLISYSFVLPASLDQNRFAQALQEVVDSNPVLRTRIVDAQGWGLFQVVIKDQSKFLSTGCIKGFLKGQTSRGKGGFGEPLNEFDIVVEKNKTFFVWAAHHAVYDAWSQSLILDQIERLYLGHSERKLCSMKTPLYFQRGLDEQSVKRFWEAQLKRCTRPPFPLNTASLNYSPTSNKSHLHLISRIPWSDSGFTVATMIRAAWAMTLSRFVGSDDVVFAVTVTGRQASIPGIEKVAAPTVCTVPVRVKIDSLDSIQVLLTNLQQQAVDMVPYEHTGLHKIHRMIDDVDLSQAMETLLVIQAQDAFTGDLFKPLAYSGSTGGSDLAVFNTFVIMLEAKLRGKDELSLHFRFDDSIIGLPQVALLASQFEAILRQFSSANPTDVVSQLNFTSETDQSLIWKWNSLVPNPIDQTVHSFIHQATHRLPPSTEAICAWDGIFTYGELQHFSDNLALALASRRIGLGDHIMICLEKSKWMPVAMLSVMKAGGVAVALDVTQPMERLSTIARQVKPLLILTSYESASLAANLLEQPPLIISENIMSRDWPDEVYLPVVQPSNKLFIVFTSGTTGIPKGVVITHSNFCSAIKYHAKMSRLNECSRVFDFASHAFDGAWVNVLQTLHAGGCVCIPSEHERRNDLGAAIRRTEANFTYLPPSLLRFLDPSSVPSLKTIFMVGEAVPEDLRAKWTKFCHVGVAYGPAECTVTSTMTDLLNPPDIHHSIGVGVGVNTWIVDTLRPMTSLAPIGSVGELWLEGPLVGPGYLNNPAENAKALVQDPQWLLQGHGSHPGRSGRLYRTRDLVRYHWDGSIRFVGRQDTQIKLRGQRIELEEVEHHLRKHLEPSYRDVRLAAEVIVPAGTITQTLVAFVETPGQMAGLAKSFDASQNLLVSLNQVGEELQDVIPGYMIPAAYIPVDTLPLSPTGKLDRLKLKHLGSQFSWKDLQMLTESNIHHKKPQIQPPSSPVMEELQRIWSEVLNIPKQDVSMAVSFTRHGGDSITAMQVVSRCREHSIQITVSRLLSGKTIEQLAASRGSTGQGSPTIEQQTQGSHAWALSPVQQMFFEMYPEGLNHYNQAFILRLRKKTRAHELLLATRQILARHGMLRARFRQRNDGSWEQYIEDMSEDSFSFTAQTVESEEDLRSLASQEQELMNIRTGPVFSVVLFSVTNTNTQYILFTAHHLVIDLVSWRVIWHDLEQLLLGNEINPAPSVSFQTWCHLQDEQIKSLHPRDLLPFDLKAPDLEYWGLTIEDNIQDSFMVDQVAFPHALTTDLLEQRNQAVQIAPVDIILGCLLHSFQIAFHDRLVPGVFFEGHGREPLLSNDASEAIDLSGTVGWFTTVHPLQVSMDATTPLLDVIHRVQLVRNNVLGKGQPYFSSTYAASGEQRGFQPHTGVEVLFNYMGAYQQLEAEESLFERYNSQDVPNQVSLTTKRVGLIETSAWVHRGELIFRFERHNRLKKMQDQFDLWMDTFSENLRHATRELQNSSKILFGLQSPSFLNVEQFFIAQGLTVDDIEAAHPCNAIQRHMLEAQAVQGPGIYVISLQFKVNLLPDETSSQRALHSAWDIIVDRYQSLRTIFLRESPFIASQFILRPAAFRRHKSSQNYQVPSGQLPVTHELTVETADSHLLVRLEVNHAIIDRISMDHILNDWQAVYSKNRLPTLYTQLNDAIPEILQLERSEVPSLFWRKTLELVKSPFTVPINSKVRQHSQNACSMTRNFPRLRDMKSAAQIHNATPTSLLYAALATTMSSQLQRDHAGFAAVSMGRSQLSPSSQDCVGPFLTLIPCIVANISMSSSVQILRATHQHMLRASDHERVDIQALGRELGETTPFNILVNYRKFSKPEPKSSAYSCHFQTLASRDLWDFDIVLGVEEIHDELAICLQWYEGRLQRDEAGRWMAALHATLHGYVEDLCLADRI